MNKPSFFFKFFFFACALLALSVNVKGEEIYSVDFRTTSYEGTGWTQKTNSNSPTNEFTLDGITWNLEAVKGGIYYYWYWDSYDGIQIGGSNNNYHTSATISTYSFAAYSIDKIIVTSRGNKDSDATLTVSVGGVEFICAESGTTTSPSVGYEATDYTFEYPEGAVGEIVIAYKETKAKGYYLRAIQIFGEADRRLDPALSYSEDYLGAYVSEVSAGAVLFPTLQYAEGFDGLSYISYSSTDSSIATISDEGILSLTGEIGKATITASFAGNDSYAPASASCDIRLKEGSAATFDFDLHTYGMTKFSSAAAEPSVNELLGDKEVSLSFTLGEDIYLSDEDEYDALKVSSGCAFTLSAPQGQYITSITFASYSSGTALTALQPDKGLCKGDEALYIWEPSDAANVESITFKADGSAASINTIDVELSAPATGSFTISSIGYATYFNDYAYEMPSGVVGTTVTSVGSEAPDGGYKLGMAWEYAAGSVVPAQTALVLRGEEGTYTYYTSPTDESAEGNLLLGATKAVTTTKPYEDNSDYYFYELTCPVGDESGEVGFYWANDAGTPFESAANKAWLALPRSLVYDIKSFIVERSEIPKVDTIETVNNSSYTNMTMYTLQGVQMKTYREKGVYIVNGKKYINK